MSSPPHRYATANTPAAYSVSLLDALQRKQQAVTALIAGRISLFEAAARFRSSQSSVARVGDVESTCRSVIGWVHLALSERPEKAEAVSARLEAELQTHLERFGSSRLPLAR